MTGIAQSEERLTLNQEVAGSIPAPGASQRQWCKVCGRLDKFDFNVTDEVWAAVLPEYLQNHVVCLNCFDSFAWIKGVSYASALRSLCFAGDRAVFNFAVEGRFE
jgi:hypothetical protein